MVRMLRIRQGRNDRNIAVSMHPRALGLWLMISFAKHEDESE